MYFCIIVFCYVLTRLLSRLCYMLCNVILCRCVSGLRPTNSLGHTETCHWVKVSSERQDKPGIEPTTLDLLIRLTMFSLRILAICNLSYFPFWVLGRDLGSDCPGSWSLHTCCFYRASSFTTTPWRIMFYYIPSYEI